MLERASAAEEKGMLEYRINIADAGEAPVYAWHSHTNQDAVSEQVPQAVIDGFKIIHVNEE